MEASVTVVTALESNSGAPEAMPLQQRARRLSLVRKLVAHQRILQATAACTRTTRLLIRLSGLTFACRRWSRRGCCVRFLCLHFHIYILYLCWSFTMLAYQSRLTHVDEEPCQLARLEFANKTTLSVNIKLSIAVSVVNLE